MAEVLWQCIQVRFELDQEWQRELVFQKMNEAWRAAKSILVAKVNAASNEEERLKLQPANIKSLHEWKDFLKEKTSANFKAKSNNLKELRNKKLKVQHTMSHKGYARLTAEMKAKHKSINMKKIERDTSNSSSTNLKEDALCKVLGPEKPGHLRTFGKGVTLTKLALLSQLSGHIAQVHEQDAQFKSQVVHLQNTIDGLKKNQVQNAAMNGGTPIVSPLRVTTNPDSNNCKLLDWMGTGEVVAEGRWSSSDPNERVHHISLGPNAMRVWVEVVKKREVFLWRPMSDMVYIEEAKGTTVAWPADKVLMDSSSMSGSMG
ncbi:hypothetical protein Vadar_007654 [Vaccinium darrowii]|uniref:Uncharacterized protein n=1 Tax=Vaccinium darrowii TaxID=229202 RepID=A0ACB7WYZ4_9ERIC|nr:hypothetical protein Vadar_007654 [Vaccinium darrowii]